MLQAVVTNEAPDDDEPIRDEKNLRDTWPFGLPEAISRGHHMP